MTDKPVIGNVNPVTESHAGHTSRDGAYLVVFICLALLTLVELVVTYVGAIKVPLLLVLAATKATLVVMFYMHLRWERRIYPLAFTAPVIAAVLVAVALQQLVLH